MIVDLPTLTEKDEIDLVEWGIPNDIDFIAASFVRKASDLEYIRKVCALLPLSCLSVSVDSPPAGVSFNVLSIIPYGMYILCNSDHDLTSILPFSLSFPFPA